MPRQLPTRVVRGRKAQLCVLAQYGNLIRGGLVVKLFPQTRPSCQVFDILLSIYDNICSNSDNSEPNTKLPRAVMAIDLLQQQSCLSLILIPMPIAGASAGVSLSSTIVRRETCPDWHKAPKFTGMRATCK
ncbi:Hypothetical predicted protein [Olea europaea subsp. europaea]|uniref:Uncharacterized protein n=1 Tax=Olea europaea subsp. europaea TaxID=158383 RepID=A0A8S0S8C8_OLEEU|nr:Hypothetical predicted protein [Olea europaea subsp. europaea]